MSVTFLSSPDGTPIRAVGHSLDGTVALLRAPELPKFAPLPAWARPPTRSEVRP